MNNNSYFYPSASIGFILTEVLKIPTNILSFLKFRASYAEVGGSAAAYQLKGKFKSFDFFRGNPALTYTDTRPPENLKPQNKRSIEFGTDIRFASNRFGFDLTWYKENTINQIMNIDIPGTTGFNRQTINAGNLQNQGWELTLRATPVRTSSLTWDITLNWSRNVNTVVALHEDINQIYLYPGPWGRVNVYARVGEPYGQMFGKDMVREHAKVYYTDESRTIRDHIEYSGRPVVDTMGEYQLSVYESLVGNIMPDWFGGISNGLNFRNFNFSFLVDFQKRR